MSMPLPPGNLTCPGSFPQTFHSGYKRFIPFPSSPAVGAGILSTFFFMFIAFLSNPLLVNVTPLTLGIVVTISTFVLLMSIIFILILL